MSEDLKDVEEHLKAASRLALHLAGAGEKFTRDKFDSLANGPYIIAMAGMILAATSAKIYINNKAKRRAALLAGVEMAMGIAELGDG
jgi:hypothetical protein